jgi:hypothetical protein
MDYIVASLHAPGLARDAGLKSRKENQIHPNYQSVIKWTNFEFYYKKQTLN